MRFLRWFSAAFLFASAIWGISSVSGVFAADFPFSDIKDGDPIRADLEKLHSRGVVDSPSDGKFHPEALMDRDEFTAVAIGVGCRKCLTPTIDDILRYRTIPFVDFERKSPYFYCVSYAKEIGAVEGYAIPESSGYSCQDGKRWEGVPFCAKNRISRIEAAAVLLRRAGLWDEARNSAPFSKRYDFPDVSDYWYGYAQKGTDVGLLSPSDQSVRPDEYLTKREFVKMAAIIFSLNLCETKGMEGDEDGKDAFDSEIRVTDPSKICRPNAPATDFSNPKNAYNFIGIPDVPTGAYSWEFSPAIGSGQTIRAEGKCLPDFKLPPGEWIAKLRIVTPDGRSSVSYAEVPSGSEKSALSVSVGVNPTEFPSGTVANFTSVVGGGTGPYVYRWDFWDGSFSSESDPRHGYESAGTYPVTLVVTDSEGNRAVSKLVVSVRENPDMDGDGIFNADDACPRVYGPKNNAGCPRIVPYVPGRSGDPFGSGGVSLGLGSVGSRCLLTGASASGAIFATTSCTACPCEYDLNFLAEVRHCDLLFPTILSLDKKTIFSRGAIYEVR